MKSLFNFSSTINTPKPRSTPNIWATMAQKAFQSRNLSVLTSLLTISGAIGIGVTVNPQRTLASACVGVYSTRNGATGSNQGFIGYFNPITNSYVDIATYTGGENINAMATQPSTGNLFFVNRNTRKIQVYNINTNTFSQLTGTLPAPPTGISIIGATFTADGKLYVYYGNKTLYDIDPSTGNVRTGTSVITISGMPGRPSASGTVNGDIAVGTDGTFYAIGEINDTQSQIFRLTVSGTTATATAVNNTTPISGTTAVNGLAIDPLTGKFYISSGGGTYELNTTTKVATRLTSTTGTNDLAACGSPTPNAPTITKAFTPNTVTGVPASSTLTLTLGNTNSVPIYLTQALVDNFQSGLTVSTPNGLTGSCTTISGNTITATAGSSSLTLANGLTIPAGGCTVSVNVTASSVGTYTNTIAAGTLTTTAGSNASTATSTFVVNPTPIDYGDAPDGAAGTGTGNYQTTSSDSGPSHVIVSGIQLGANIDADSGTLQNINADADDTNGTPNDEDGVKIGANSLQNQTLTQGASVTLDITTQGSGRLNAWIDWNQDGDFLDAGEKIATDVSPTSNAISLPITVPATATTGTTYARFRYSTQTGLAPTGAASDGEVEDYKLTINTSGTALSCPSELLGNWSRNSTVSPNRNEVYKINPSNGAAIPPKIADTNWTSGSGVDPTGRYMFYVDRTVLPNKVQRLDLVTLADIDTGYTVPATGLRVAVHPTDGNLYVLNGASPGPITLYKAPYGSVPVAAGTAMTLVGNLVDDPDNGSTNSVNTISGGDIAFDKLGNLYLIEQGRKIFAINANLKAIYLNTLTVSGLSPSPAGLAFVGNKLYAADSASPGNLYFINLVNNSIDTQGAAGIPTLPTASGVAASYWGDLASCQYPEPEIVAEKTVSKVAGSSGSNIQPGDTLEYTIVVRNQSQIYAVDVRLSDSIPANTTYVAGSTQVNYNAGTATDFESLADVSGVMPFAVPGGTEIKTFGRSPGVLQPDDDTTINSEAIIKFRVKVNTANPPTQVSNQGIVSYPNPSTGANETLNTDDPTTTDLPNDPTIVLVQSISQPKLLLVKRITAINGNNANNPNDNTPLNQFVDGGTNNDDDNNANWPTPQNLYLPGAINGGLVKSGDEVEYTIYFLNTDANARNVKLCDTVPDNQTFVPTAYNSASPRPLDTESLGTDTGIALGFSSTSLPTSPTVYLTNLQDTATGDRGRFYPAGDLDTPATCKKFDTSGNVTATGVAANTNGAVVVDIVKGTDVIPPAIGAGTPSNSYGFIRFRAKLNP